MGLHHCQFQVDIVKMCRKHNDVGRSPSRNDLNPYVLEFWHITPLYVGFGKAEVYVADSVPLQVVVRWGPFTI